MDLNCETVLDVYTYKKRKILCQIKVNCNSGKFKNSFRCLSQEQWMTFDMELEKLITTIDDWSNEKCLKFKIKPFILVRVQKSSLPLKHFLKCLQPPSGFVQDVGGEVEESHYILECLFDFQRDFCLSTLVDSQKTTLDGMSCNPIKKYKMNEISTVMSPDVDFLGYDENSYIQKSIFKEDNDSRLTHDSELKFSNATRNEINKNENVSESLNDSKSSLNAVRSSRDINKSNKNQFVSKEDEEISPNEDNYIQIDSSQVSKMEESNECYATDAKLDSNLKADNSRKPKERLKSEDIFLELNDENDKEKHRSKHKKHRKDKDYSHNDDKTIKKPNTLDEFPKEVLKHTEKTLLKTTMGGDNKQKESSRNNDEKMSSLKKKSEKQSTSLLIAGELTPTYTNKLKKSPKTPLENENLSDSPLEETLPKSRRKERKPKYCNKDEIVVRRSERSPSKTKRLVDELHEHVIKRKKHKSNKNRELFGTDDEEDNLFEAKKETINDSDKKSKLTNLEIPVNKKSLQHTSSSSSKKTKRKSDTSSECQEEKRAMNKWLGKKSSKSLSQQSKISPKSFPKRSQSKPLPLKNSTNAESRKVESDLKTPSKSVTPPTLTIELPSKEELELIRNKTNLIREENARVKAELDKLRTSSPKEVAILSLEDIPVDDILSSFSIYRAELDEVFQNNRKKDHIKGHDGINHCFIIRLLQQNIQMKMLEKLTDVYGGSNTTTQATLFANALLPEWVIRVYMEKFNFTREQAIEQIKAQEAFQLHMEEENDNSFEFN